MKPSNVPSLRNGTASVVRTPHLNQGTRGWVDRLRSKRHVIRYMEETVAAYQSLDSGARGKGPECLIEELLRQPMQCDSTDKLAVTEH